MFNRPNDCHNSDISTGGFDIVIGNPPYVEAKKLKYISARLKENFLIYSGTADISIYFIELGLRICKTNGLATFITTNKFFTTGYGENVRKLLLDNTIRQIIDFEQVEVFENVLVSSVILGIQKFIAKEKNEFRYQKYYQLKNKEFKEIFSEENNFSSYSQDVLNSREWSFADATQLELKNKIETNGKLIKDVDGISVYRGVTTGYNPAFIITDEKRDELIKADKKNKDIIKNMLQGRNIRKWVYNESNENIIFTRRHINIDLYPIIKKHLYQFYNQLKPKKKSDDIYGRKPGNYKWYEIVDNTAYYHEFEKSEKIIWGLTADKWAFAYDDKKHYLPSNAYILTSEKLPIKFLLGILNSKVLKYYFGFIGVLTAGGAYTLKHATIQMLPIPPATLAQQKPIIALVDKILAAKKADAAADTSELEKQIDKLVYALYNLTKEEIKIVEVQDE